MENWFVDSVKDIKIPLKLTIKLALNTPIDGIPCHKQGGVNLDSTGIITVDMISRKNELELYKIFNYLVKAIQKFTTKSNKQLLKVLSLNFSLSY
jgi:hypothetical protein